MAENARKFDCKQTLSQKLPSSLLLQSSWVDVSLFSSCTLYLFIPYLNAYSRLLGHMLPHSDESTNSPFMDWSAVAETVQGFHHGHSQPFLLCLHLHHHIITVSSPSLPQSSFLPLHPHPFHHDILV